MTQSITPPAPEALAASLSPWQLMRVYRADPLQIWPQHAYEDDSVIQRVFGQTSLLINSPEAIRRVLVTNAGNYGRSELAYRVIGPLIGEGLALAEGDDWRHERHATASAFAPRAIPEFGRTTAEVLVDSLPSLADHAGRPFDLLVWFQDLTIDVSGRAMFSLPLQTLAPSVRRLVAAYGKWFGRASVLDFLLPLWLPGPRDIGRRFLRWRWLQLVDRMIAERRRHGRNVNDGAHDLFEVLQAFHHPESGEPFTYQALRDQVATLITAAHHTTAVAMFWATFLLTEAPDWQERVAAEVRSFDLSPAAAAAAVPYLITSRAVIDEAMRLYPPVFIIARVAKGTDLLVDTKVQAGTAVTIAPWVLHRHRRLWQQPEVFDPSRFLPGAPPIRRFAYLPFGAGPRICIGAPLALTEATLVLATMIQRFCVARAERAPVLPVGVLNTQPNRSVPFVLTPR